MTLAPGYEFGIEMGSLVSEDQVKTVSGHVDDAVAKGATVVAGGKARPDLGPLFYEPTVLTGVTPEMECYANETFGPLVAIYPVADVEEAIARANDTDYGLNASVWAGSHARARPSRPRHGGHRQRRRGLRPHLGQHRRPDGRHGGVGRRPPPRRRGSAQVHGGADRRDHQGGQSRWSAVAAGQGLGQAVAAPSRP